LGPGVKTGFAVTQIRDSGSRFFPPPKAHAAAKKPRFANS
jgi:hypothetical protein